MSIRYKILLTLLLLGFFTHSVITSIYYGYSQNIIERLATYHLNSMASVQNQRMAGFVSANLELLNLIKSRTQMRRSLHHYIGSGSEDSLLLVNKILSDAVEQSPSVRGIFILDDKGRVITSSDGTFQRQQFGEHKLFTEGRVHPTASLLLGSLEQQSPTFIFSAPIENDRQFLGVVVMEVDMERVNAFMRDYSGLGQTGEVLMATETDEGNILFFTPLRFGGSPMLFKKSHTMSELMSSELREGAGTLRQSYDYRGKLVLSISQFMPDLGISIIVKMDQEEVLRINRELKQLIIYLIFFMVIVLLVASLALAHKITKPVINLTEVAVMISHGHLEKRIEQYTDDELGRLGQALNTMADRLINSNQLLEQKVKEKTCELRDMNVKLELLAQTDALTGIKNRGYFNSQVEVEWRRNMRQKTPISFLIIDIDYFKLINDRKGHLVGDEYLKSIAHTLQRSIRRAEDIIARYGGEEFVVILNSTREEEAIRVANTIREKVMELRLDNQHSDISEYVTVSIGVSTVTPEQTMSFVDYIDYADQALYLAKSSGRNCVKTLTDLRKAEPNRV